MYRRQLSGLSNLQLSLSMSNLKSSPKEKEKYVNNIHHIYNIHSARSDTDVQSIITKRGYLRRKTLLAWKTNYYKLIDCVLFEFKNEESTRPKKAITLRTYLIKSSEDGFILIDPNKNSIIFTASSEMEKREWISALSPYCKEANFVWQSDDNEFVKNVLNENMRFALNNSICILQQKFDELHQKAEKRKKKYQELKLKYTLERNTGYSSNVSKTIDLSKITINQRIARMGGSFAVVYACNVDGWQCAMKEMQLAGIDQTSIKNFENEIIVLERLPDHKNLVKYLFHIKNDIYIRLFMKIYAGSLFSIIDERNKVNMYFNKQDIIKYLLDIISGLKILHSYKIIHRDLKSGNILVTLKPNKEIENLCIGDFDTARYIGFERYVKTIAGTTGYIAPEITGKNDYSYPVDIWSLGVVGYEIITLDPPLSEKTFDISEKLNKLVDAEMDDPPVLDEKYFSIEKIIRRCLVTNPIGRISLKKCQNLLLDLLGDFSSFDIV